MTRVAFVWFSLAVLFVSPAAARQHRVNLRMAGFLSQSSRSDGRDRL
jgi:hypothetical protein